MSRNSKLISENLREEIARELGVYEQVKKDGGSWGNVSSKDCGNIVSKAIEIANRAVELVRYLDRTNISSIYYFFSFRMSCKKMIFII